MSEINEAIQEKCLAFSDRIIKLNDYLLAQAVAAHENYKKSKIQKKGKQTSSFLHQTSDISVAAVPVPLSPLNNMKKIDIAAILSPDLKSRMRAQDLKALIENSGADAVEMDFHGVKFATRSFIDEFYNLFLKTPDANTFHVELINVPSDIKAMLDSVSRTQVRAKVIPSQSQEVAFKDVREFLNYFSTVVL